MLAQTVTDACGIDASTVCSFVFDLTGNETLAELTDFLSRPVKVILILLGAWIVNRIAHRSIDRSVSSWLDNRAEAAEKMVAAVNKG